MCRFASSAKALWIEYVQMRRPLTGSRCEGRSRLIIERGPQLSGAVWDTDRKGKEEPKMAGAMRETKG